LDFVCEGIPFLLQFATRTQVVAEGEALLFFDEVSQIENLHHKTLIHQKK
jgi:hypothetical protein